MTNNNTLLKQAKSAKGIKDHRETSAGGGFDMPEAGKAPARFIGYVELGSHPQPDFQGKSKDPARELMLTFEVFGTKNTREIEVDGKTKKVGALLTVRITEKQSDRAKFKKLFDKMAYDRDVAHMSHMLNEVFLVTVRHGTAKKSGRKYATIEAEDGTFNIGEPVIEMYDDDGELTGTKDISEKTPQASLPLRLFLFDNPTIEQWDSIFIDGTYTKKVKGDDGEEVEQEHSKNFLQEQIMRSLDFDGSPMQELLGELGEDESEEAEEEEEIEEEQEEAEEEEEAPVAKPAPKKAAAKAPAKAPVSAPAKKSPAVKTAPVSSQKTSKASPTTSAKSAKTKSPSKSKTDVDNSVDDDLAAMGL